MRHVLHALALVVMMLGMTTNAMGTPFSWSPNPADLEDLDHNWYWKWGISKNDSQGQTLYSQLNSGNYSITSAKLTFNNIWDWIVEPNDRLYVNLLDNPTAGTNKYWDNEGGGNNFNGQGTSLGYWTDPYGGNNGANKTTKVFDLIGLGALNNLTQYILNNNSNSFFGFGIDPDCHYWNTGITFQITTTQNPSEPVVPEPATLGLIGLGMAGIGAMRRRSQARTA